MNNMNNWILIDINDLPPAERKPLLKALMNKIPLNRRLRKILIKAKAYAENADIADCLTQKEYQE